jgi:hypothetical protein
MQARGRAADQTGEMVKGGELLLRHCAALEELEATRPSARERVAELLGEELAALLIPALRWRRLPERSPGSLYRRRQAAP